MNQSVARVLVYLAAALMPWDLSFAAACPCTGGTAGANSPKSCCGTPGCTCHHAAKPAKRSCCSAGKASLQAASPAGNTCSVECKCRAKNQPQPQTPSNDSRNLKEQLAAAPSSVTAPLGIPPADAACTSAANFSFYPLSALERCGALCRFLI
jgi:hypothetical protein